MLFHKERALPDLADNIKCGNTLIGPDYYNGRSQQLFEDEVAYRINAFDWKVEFAEPMSSGGFDGVIGNPPWGQKAVDDDKSIKEYVRGHYASTTGIYDLFRPFVEKGVRLVKDRGWFGMVLPDIILLKDYPETRLFLLHHLRLAGIDWWGMAFADAVIDAATIVGCRETWADSHQVRVGIHDVENPLCHQISQADFVGNRRHVFNLFLTREKREIVNGLESFPKLGDFFEIHEGVHSGNIRSDLFVEQKIDATCEELLFGRDEIAPYLVRWHGKFIRLSSMPSKKSRQRYANIGHETWHHREKLLVRRTGDYVLAAVDGVGRYASNNFFIVFPKRSIGLDLYGLAALLNSKFMTWYFRTIEPRRGRVFAELKIKHLETFPLPTCDNGEDILELNRLGHERAKLANLIADGRPVSSGFSRMDRAREILDQQIEEAVCRAFGLSRDFVRGSVHYCIPNA